ncbi:MAG: hypothetical protein HN753_00940 [Methylococcales bacterium]|jgi:hypothetical protein|nr:hypothetical protein [Methylococcales bacterium]MBT7967832.1 hypothetical protein [Methylococcales bacterium]
MESFIKIILLSASIIMVGCAPNVRPVQSESVVVNVPKVGYEKTGELGGTLVSKIIKTEIEAIKVNNSVDCCLALTFQAGTYVAIWEDNRGIYYGSPNNVLVKFSGKRQNGGYVVPFGSRSSQQNVAVWQGALPTLRPTAKVSTDSYITFTRGKVTKTNEPFFKQELIYNGKSGSNIKFLYRELADNMMRASFSQDIQYDLNESNVIGFKGSRIKVIEASNQASQVCRS